MVLPIWSRTEASGIVWPSMTITGAVATWPIMPLAIGSIAMVVATADRTSRVSRGSRGNRYLLRRPRVPALFAGASFGGLLG